MAAVIIYLPRLHLGKLPQAQASLNPASTQSNNYSFLLSRALFAPITSGDIFNADINRKRSKPLKLKVTVGNIT